ncbi:MAG: hypothetical protein WD851_10620 [Pirellulales bacterium]
MSHTIQLPLETYFLTQQSAALDCIVCGHENCLAAERCHGCSAPLALARQATKLRAKTHFIAVLGASGVGKTIYLGMLMDMLIRRVGALRATFRGPHSISLQQTTTTALASGWYPDRTSRNPEDWDWVQFQMYCGRKKQAFELVLPDISGEALAEEVDHEGRYPAIRGLLARCSAVVVLADAERLQAGDHADDFVTLKLMTLLSELTPRATGRIGRLKRRREKRPLALVLTKADTCQTCADNPTAFAENHATSLLHDCQSRFPNTRVFAGSVAGASVWHDVGGRRRQAPLRIEPHGVVEPFGWLLTQLS